MAENQTRPTDAAVSEFIDRAEPARRREDARALDAIFREVTGWTPQMWGPAIIGYGSYHYKYDSGREGDMCATGFSPRKANLVLYIMPGYQNYGAMLERLGKHKLGKSCLYLNKLADVDEGVLREIIRTGLDDLAKKYPVTPA
ncbi:DUF1801 domain-containing protein [Maritimibacter sp. UBA3975]|uniref:DUF1801 domain-containing protein n=1 Tax=Maritimibacter sp. UBA3975 TaxID=1946833 RepID=UPI000C0AF648|nr:DUF1801 domain-containing protein [Maritimibacter sp. UBA3975]MAM62745.1 hypothetical protein [Maritimibacter sp.]|tara:strand:+ start:902 stop:1330 length:429 start_codon:yes stop_codon:yes gene_type:complete